MSSPSYHSIGLPKAYSIRSPRPAPERQHRQIDSAPARCQSVPLPTQNRIRSRTLRGHRRRVQKSRAEPARLQCTTARFPPPSVSFWRKLLEQVRPVARDDAAYLVVDLGDVVEAFLNLPADHLELLRAEGPTVHEFDWHTFAPPCGRRHRVQPGDTGIGALPGHQEHRKPSTRLPTEASGWRSKVRISIARACATAWTVNVQPRRSGDDGAADRRRPQRRLLRIPALDNA